MFETVVLFDKCKKEVTLGTDPTNVDGLNFLSGKTMGFVNQKAFEGTVLAHNDGGVPNIVLNVPEMNESELGYLIYFFEKACAISGYMLGVNPFNQPGVEATRRICSLFSASRAMRIRRLLLRQDSDNFLIKYNNGGTNYGYFTYR